MVLLFCTSSNDTLRFTVHLAVSGDVYDGVFLCCGNRSTGQREYL